MGVNVLAFEANTVSVCTKSFHLVHATVASRLTTRRKGLQTLCTTAISLGGHRRHHKGSVHGPDNFHFVASSPSCRSSYTFIPFLISYHSTGWSVVEEGHRMPTNSNSTPHSQPCWWTVRVEQTLVVIRVRFGTCFTTHRQVT
jgi:hypothetical protein